MLGSSSTPGCRRAPGAAAGWEAQPPAGSLCATHTKGDYGANIADPWALLGCSFWNKTQLHAGETPVGLGKNPPPVGVRAISEAIKHQQDALDPLPNKKENKKASKRRAQFHRAGFGAGKELPMGSGSRDKNIARFCHPLSIICFTNQLFGFFNPKRVRLNSRIYFFFLWVL